MPPLHPSVVATLGLVHLVAAAPLAPQPEPHLDHILALALECATEPAPPDTLPRWIDRAQASVPSEAFTAQLHEIQLSVAEVRARGMNDVLQWLVNELRTLVAHSDEDELSLALNPHPPPLLRASPLGAYVRRSALAYSRLDFAQTAEWWAAFERWCDGAPGGEGREAKRRREVPSFARARLQQDYHAARELVRTFVPEGQKEATAQHALLHLALVEYEDGGFEEAQLALDEATQIARTVGDTACLAACASLRLRLEAVAPTADAKTSKKARAAKDSPHDLLWEIGQRCSQAQGAPLDILFPQLFLARAAAQHRAFPPARPAPSSNKPHAAQRRADPPDVGFDAAWHAAAAGLWSAMGIDPLARTHDALALELLDPVAPEWTVRLAVLRRRVSTLISDNRHDAARMVLLRAVETRGLRAGMGVREVRRWRKLLELVEADEAVREKRGAGEKEDEPAYARLVHAATAAHVAALGQREPARLDALLDLLDERQRAGGDAGRGLRELEEAWSAVLALEEGDGAGGEGERGVRAREVRVLGMLAARADDTLLPELVDELAAVADRYLALSRGASAQRALHSAALIADHLVATEGSSAEFTTAWVARRDALATQWLAIERGAGKERNRVERVARVAALVERAVSGSARGMGRHG